MSVWKKFTAWLLPGTVTTRARVLAAASLATELIIVGTGGTVRLTGSGLGCPTWPECTGGSLIPVPELGYHAIIEFSNRTMSGVVAVVALLMFFFVLRLRRSHPILFWLSFSLGALVLVQAAIGGITVLSSLESYIVGLHFVLSALMVVLATWLVWMVNLPEPKLPPLPARLRNAAWSTAVLATATVVVGILTTGSGPHAGDLDTPRNGLPTNLLEHLHAWPAYATFGLTVVLLLMAWSTGFALTRNLALWLLAAESLQIVIGLYQARNRIPPLAVGIHMVLACVLLAVMTIVVLSTARPRPQREPDPR